MKLRTNLCTHTGLAVLMLLLSLPTITMAAEKAAKKSSTLSGNITAVSTYVWRGLPQTIDAALQGGVDYATSEGLHVGAWTSNVTAGSELDLIVGFAGATKGIGFDVGLIIYKIPQYEAAAGPTQDFECNELYGSISVNMINARISTSSEAGTYIEVNADLEKVVAGWDLGLHFGTYDVDADFSGLPGEDYDDYSVSLGTKINGLDLSFTLSDTNLSDDSYRTIIAISKDFTP